MNVGIGSTGNTEVEDLRLAAFVHQDVAGLQVTVNHAFLVGVLDGVANVRNQRQAPARV